MKEEGLEEVLAALQSLLEALERADMEIPEVSVLAEVVVEVVVEEERQERAKRLLDGW